VKVFISWSGSLSRQIAADLAKWLPLVVQHVKPWTSDENIESGSRWAEKIDEGLTESDYGIVCITADNQHSPWLMFEAGGARKGGYYIKSCPAVHRFAANGCNRAADIVSRSQARQGWNTKASSGAEPGSRHSP
jgi:TIR domain